MATLLRSSALRKTARRCRAARGRCRSAAPRRARSAAGSPRRAPGRGDLRPRPLPAGRRPACGCSGRRRPPARAAASSAGQAGRRARSGLRVASVENRGKAPVPTRIAVGGATRLAATIGRSYCSASSTNGRYRLQSQPRAAAPARSRARPAVLPAGGASRRGGRCRPCRSRSNCSEGDRRPRPAFRAAGAAPAARTACCSALSCTSPSSTAGRRACLRSDCASSPRAACRSPAPAANPIATSRRAPGSRATARGRPPLQPRQRPGAQQHAALISSGAPAPCGRGGGARRRRELVRAELAQHHAAGQHRVAGARPHAPQDPAARLAGDLQRNDLARAVVDEAAAGRSTTIASPSRSAGAMKSPITKPRLNRSQRPPW